MALVAFLRVLRQWLESFTHGAVNDSGLRKTCFVFKRNQPTCFSNTVFFGFFFEKIQVFVLLRETQKSHSEMFLMHLMHYHHFQNYTIITCCTYCGIQNLG